jgi:hypothetical protein
VVVTLISFLCWSGWELGHESRHPFGDLSVGAFTDHFTHLSTTRLFPRVGWNIWLKPVRDHGRVLTAAEKAQLPDDIKPAAGPQGEVYQVEGWPTDKPIIASWSHLPRLHPPGDIVLLAPVAALYQFTPLSFAGSNRLLILLFLLYAHLSLYFFFDAALRPREGETPLGLLPLLLVYGEVIHWTLEGFYEPAILAPLLLCTRWLRDGRPLAAIVAYCVAANIHFRSFFFAPWVLYGAFLIVRQRQWKAWRRPDWIAAGVAGVLTFTCLGVFFLLWPALKALPMSSNPLSFARAIDQRAVFSYLAVGLAVAAIFAYARAWLDLAVLVWVTVMLVSLKETYEWDVVTLLAWLGAPVAKVAPGRVEWVRDTRLLFVLFCAVLLFRTNLMPTWVRLLF